MSNLDDSFFDDLLTQATCAIFIGGKLKGTAWLVSDEGHLLTAGHILGTDRPLAEVEVRFAEDVPRKAHKTQWGYQQEMGIDFAVLKLVDPPVNRHPLPILLTREVSGSFRACGFGVSLKDRSFGRGKFLGPIDLQNAIGNRLFELSSGELGEEGYSGTAIFSDELQAVVAIQVEATKAKTGPGRDTILAMPLYRIVPSWERLEQEAKEAIRRREFPPQSQRTLQKDTRQSLPEGIWLSLLRSIKDGNCTPFLGSGIYSGVLPSRSDIAKDWADKYGYPLDNPHRLSRVAQFLSMDVNFMFPRQELAEKFKVVNPSDLAKLNELHRILADLPLPIYITTNYDDFMVQALNHHEYKSPIQELCRWNDFIKNQSSIFKTTPGFRPTPEEPIVFHLYGYLRKGSDALPESLVLTEDDYLNFLVEVSKNGDLLPPRIQESLARTSLLFLGYRVTDWDFRILLHIVGSYLKKSLYQGGHICVQLVPEGDEFSDSEKAKQYLDSYFDDLDIRVYWGTYREFITELGDRWRKFNRD